MLSMKKIALASAGACAVLALAVPAVATAQSAAPAAAPPARPTPIIAWAPKPNALKPLEAPNKIHTKLSDILAKHRGKASWVEPVVRNADFSADYVAMAPGEKTKTQFYADDRAAWIVQDGAIRFTIEGQEPFVATKGFLVQVPFRVPFTLESVGDKPSLHFAVRRTGAIPLFPENVTPDAAPAGETYQKVSFTGKGAYDDVNRPYLDFQKEIVNGTRRGGAFVSDANTFVNIIRGPAQQRAPDTNRGHFHMNYDEFWLVLEGKIDYLIEGVPFFTADEGDIVLAPVGRWHRASWSSQGTTSTRLAINPRPSGLHNYAAEAGARQ
jgi:mannose-6-phosphate isomerase-like protein (cupin superfamily)